MSYCLTFSHCFLCYKETADKTEAGDGSSSSTNSIARLKQLGKNKELCKRFCTLASRFLDMDEHYFKPQKTLNSKCAINLQTLCSPCDEMVSSFCDVYEQIEHLKVQLDWRVHEIAKVMQFADSDSSYASYRQQLKTKLEKRGSSTDELEDFRREFYSAVRDRKKDIFPKVSISRRLADHEASKSKLRPPHHDPQLKTKHTFKKLHSKSSKDDGSKKMKMKRKTESNNNNREVRKAKEESKKRISDTLLSDYDDDESLDFIPVPTGNSLPLRKRKKHKRRRSNFEDRVLTDNEDSRHKRSKDYYVKPSRI